MALEVYEKETNVSKEFPKGGKGASTVWMQLLQQIGYTDGRFAVSIVGHVPGGSRLQRKRIKLTQPVPNGVEFKMQLDGNDEAFRGVLETPRDKAEEIFTAVARVLNVDDEEDEKQIAAPAPVVVSKSFATVKEHVAALKVKVAAFKKAEDEHITLDDEVKALQEEEKGLENRLTQIGALLAEKTTRQDEVNAILEDPEFKQAAHEFEELKKDLGL